MVPCQGSEELWWSLCAPLKAVHRIPRSTSPYVAIVAMVIASLVDWRIIVSFPEGGIPTGDRNRAPRVVIMIDRKCQSLAEVLVCSLCDTQVGRKDLACCMPMGTRRGSEVAIAAVIMFVMMTDGVCALMAAGMCDAATEVGFADISRAVSSVQIGRRLIGPTARRW